MNRCTKNKSFASKYSRPYTPTHELNVFATSTNAPSREPHAENSSKCFTRSSMKPPLTNSFVNNTFSSINRPCYDQNYSSLWSESPTALQPSAHTYGLPYYLRNTSSTSSTATSVNNELAKNGSVHKNTSVSKVDNMPADNMSADNMPIYQPNLAQIFWDRMSEPTKSFQNSYEKKCLATSKNHVNWMTTDSNNHSKVNSSNQSENVGSFVNTYHVPSQTDDILSSASSRLLDSANFLSEPTLPNLNGDLALSTISTSCIHNTGNSARHSNIQDDSLILNKFSKNTTPDTNNYYQRVNNFSAESLFSNIVSSNTGSDAKRQKNSNEYFSSPLDTNSDVGLASNTMTTTPFFHRNFENSNCSATNGSNTTSQIPTNDLHYTHYSPYNHHQHSKNCNDRVISENTIPQSASGNYKNMHSISSTNPLPFTVPIFRDPRKAELSSHNENFKIELGVQGTATVYENNADCNKSSKNMVRGEAATDAIGNFDNNYLDRSMYGTNGNAQPHSKIVFSNSSTRSKTQRRHYNHSSSVPVNINSESTNSISNTITNFNLSTICPEIDRDFLIK